MERDFYSHYVASRLSSVKRSLVSMGNKIAHHITVYKVGLPWRLWGVISGYWQLVLQLVITVVSDLFLRDFRVAQS